MPPRLILDGKAVAAKVLADVKAGGRGARARARGVHPTLAVILVGEDPASQVYVPQQEAGGRRGRHRHARLPLPAGLQRRRSCSRTIAAINARPAPIHGILLQLPLPKGIDEDAAVAAIAPAKDADGLHPVNLGNLLAGQAGGGAVHAGRAASRSSTTTASRSRAPRPW